MREGAKKKITELINPLMIKLGDKLTQLQADRDEHEGLSGAFTNAGELPEEAPRNPEVQYKIALHTNLTKRIDAWEAATRGAMLSVRPENEVDFLRNVSVTVEDFNTEIDNI